MACHHVKIGDSVGIICTGRRRTKLCRWCGNRSSLLCDFPVERNGRKTTCDASMCGVSVGEELDYCPPHFRHAEKTKTLPTVTGRLFD